MGNLTASASLGLDAFEGAILELRPFATEEDLQEVIQAVYRQVLGNVHIMENQRLASAEALLRDGSITVKGFVRAVAQSDLYRSLFFEPNSPYRFTELNFKHLLGRAPQDQAEISEHTVLYNEQGYEADINSFLDSEEYNSSFGEDRVPYPRSIASQQGIKTEGFNRMFALLRGPATSDRGKNAQLIASVAANLPTPVKAPSAAKSGSYDNTGKQFKIVYSTSQGAARLQRFSQKSKVVTYSQMSQIIQVIHRSGGKISKITELA
ncbi:MAG: photosystem I reaction center subunit XII [Leptolyngbya sp. SIOISBB]|nr:photosystem I reaction center subunit XII [Leptolyngbya sp. SIOISBB]